VTRISQTRKHALNVSTSIHAELREWRVKIWRIRKQRPNREKCGPIVVRHGRNAFRTNPKDLLAFCPAFFDISQKFDTGRVSGIRVKEVLREVRNE
jgi:hypothetical protein